MKLSKEQIEQVELYLTDKGLKYIDIRYEVLDHMVTDIEEKMISKQLSFKDAFEIVYLKWNKNFIPKSNFFIGSGYTGPKIFIDNCFTIYKKIILKIQFFSFLLFYGLDYFLKQIAFPLSNYNKEINIAYKTTIIISVIVMLYWFFQIKRSKRQSSFSFLFIRQIIPVTLIFALLGILMQDAFSLGKLVSIFLLFGLWSGSQLYKNHIKSVSLYSSISTQ